MVLSRTLLRILLYVVAVLVLLPIVTGFLRSGMPWGQDARGTTEKRLPFGGARVTDRFQKVTDPKAQAAAESTRIVLSSERRKSKRQTAREALGCSIPGGACSYHAPSTSLQLFEIILGKTERRAHDPPESTQLRLHVARAYIDWTPYLEPGPIRQIRLNTVLPDLGPEALLQSQVKGTRSREVKEAAHRARVPISIHFTRMGLPQHCKGSSSPVCAPYFTDRLLNHYVGEGRRYDQLCEDEIEGFECWATSRDNVDVMRTQFLIPHRQSDIGTTHLRCERRPYQKYLWCGVTAQIAPDIAIEYHFEWSRIAEYQAIHDKVRTFVLSLIVNREVVVLPLESSEES